MSLISIDRISNDTYCIHTYTIVDSDFGSIKIISKFTIGYVVAQVYSERNLPVGSNIARALLYWRAECKRLYNDDYDIVDIIKMQDASSSNQFPNWAQYAKERDEYLEKLLPLL